MIPYSFTLTSHFSITFGLALTIFIAVNIIAIRTHKLHFLGFFIPGGSPLALAPLFIIVELLSYFARVISISMRLFANLLAGHMLLKILAGFAWMMLSAGGIWIILQLFPLLIIIAITALEIAIAVVQAYVFTILTCLYLKDAIALH